MEKLIREFIFGLYLLGACASMFAHIYALVFARRRSLDATAKTEPDVEAPDDDDDDDNDDADDDNDDDDDDDDDE